MLDPLQALRKIFQEAGELSSTKELLDLIVKRVRDALLSDVCSIYLLDDEENRCVLRATDGLKPSAVGVVSMALGEGLVGYICQHQSVLNLENGQEHPNFKLFPEANEVAFVGFLGVPIISFRKMIGVLVVQTRIRRVYTSEEEAFLFTIAAQLAGPLKNLVSQDPLKEDVKTPTLRPIRVKGVKGSTGLAVGVAYFAAQFKDLSKVVEKDTNYPETEIKRFREAVEAVKLEVQAGGDKLESSISKDVHALFGVYLLLLDNESFILETEDRIKSGLNAISALKQTTEFHAARFEEMDDPYLKARAEDIWHIGSKIYARLEPGRREIKLPSKPFILIAKTLSITDIAHYAEGNLAGIVCMEGSSLSHTVVLANAMGIPSVMGIGDLQRNKVENRMAVMDGYRGQLIFNASKPLLVEYRRLRDQEKRLVTGLQKYRDLPAETPDGVCFNLYSNTGLLADVSPGLERGAEGVGLYRSEIPFMIHDTFPTEDEQISIYRNILEAYAPRSVYMRTLDIGGDKGLPYFEFKEENPYLGWRGIRFTLDNGSIFLAQIRAMLQANLGLENLRIMLPMVSSVEEVDNFKALMDEAIRQLHDQGIEVKKPSVGVMIEVPSAVVIMKFLASRIDFISIGSNDLTQYLLAVDRNNPKVSSLYSWLHPAVVHTVSNLITEAHKYRLPVSVCGEMAGDPAAVILLMGMGVDTLSVSAFNIPKVKWIIRTITSKIAKSTLSKALNLESTESISLLLNDLLEKEGLGALTRAGN